MLSQKTRYTIRALQHLSDNWRRGPVRLDAIAEASGGEVLRDTFRRILQAFRSRYILAYTPTGVAAGGFHRLDVRVKRRGLTVKARPGYTDARKPQ